MLHIPVSEIPEAGILITEGKRLRLEDLGLSDPFVVESGVVVGWDIRRVLGNFLVKARGEGRIHAQCGRCLDGFEKDIQTDFLIEFDPVPSRSEAEKQSEAHPGVSFVRDAKINLGEEFRQELELAVPLFALCQENCKGLCGQCGINLNRKSCNCGDQSTHRPFSGLKDLLDSGKTAD